MYNCTYNTYLRISVCFCFLSFSFFFFSFFFSTPLFIFISVHHFHHFYGIHLHFCRTQTKHGNMQWNTHTHTDIYPSISRYLERWVTYSPPPLVYFLKMKTCVCLCLNSLMRTLWGVSKRKAVRAYEPAIKIYKISKSDLVRFLMDSAALFIHQLIFS